MIRYLQNSEIDYEKWDACIRDAFNGNLYAWSWYLDIVCEGWGALVQGDYEQVMPLTAGKKFGVSYLYQPPFTQQLGVFCSGPDIANTDGFLETLPVYYRFAEINLNRFNKPRHAAFQTGLRKNYELELIRPYTDLQKGYSSNTIRNIRKAEKEGLSISWNADPQSIIEMFRSEKGKVLNRLGAIQYKMLEKLIYRATYKKIATIAGVYDNNNQLCAGVFLMQSHQRLVFLFSANNQVGRMKGAMHFVVHNIIGKFSGQPLILDFEGSEIPGLARFYAGFGSAETHYPTLAYNNLPLATRLAIKAVKLIKR